MKPYFFFNNPLLSPVVLAVESGYEEDEGFFCTVPTAPLKDVFGGVNELLLLLLVLLLDELFLLISPPRLAGLFWVELEESERVLLLEDRVLLEED